MGENRRNNRCCVLMPWTMRRLRGGIAAVMPEGECE